jgi:hypothetical protein
MIPRATLREIPFYQIGAEEGSLLRWLKSRRALPRLAGTVLGQQPTRPNPAAHPQALLMNCRARGCYRGFQIARRHREDQNAEHGA